MGNEFSCLYPYSREEARRRNELDEWRKSHNENIRCRNAIETAASAGQDQKEMAARVRKILDEYGFKRVGYVLSNTIQQRAGEGWADEEILRWGRRAFIPDSEKVRQQITAACAPDKLLLVLRRYQREYQKLGLFGQEHCQSSPDGGMDYQGRGLILSPKTLSEEYWKPEFQLWYAHSGFGCSPKARGRSILATCLGDGEMTRWNRSDFTGAIQEELLPDWAQKKLSQLLEVEQKQAEHSLTMG